MGAIDPPKSLEFSSSLLHQKQAASLQHNDPCTNLFPQWFPHQIELCPYRRHCIHGYSFQLKQLWLRPVFHARKVKNKEKNGITITS